jgi:hypothetical protein
MYQYDFDGSRYIDSGCCDADKAINGKSKCTECPYKKCIQTLRGQEKNMILASSIIMQSFSLYDKLQSYYDVARIMCIPHDRLRGWMRSRDKIEKKIADYALCYGQEN